MIKQRRDADIVSAYKSGERVRVIADDHGLTQQHVYNILRAKGVKPNRSKANCWREQGQA